MQLVSDTTPVAVFAYNRPEHLRLTIEALNHNELASDTALCVFSDAPRNAAAEEGVFKVRQYLRSVTGFKSLRIIERERNFGLAASVIDGVGQLVSEYGRVIVLEDDLITAPGFLNYMNLALERYQFEDRIMQVAAHMFPVELDAVTEDALFLPFISSWGWGTWGRAWRHFDAAATGYTQLRDDKRRRKEFDLKGHYRYFRMLESYMRGSVDSWAIRWYLSVFLRQGLALYPKRSLVENIGFDGTGVNCAVSDMAQQSLDAGFRATRLPSAIAVSESFDQIVRGIPSGRFKVSSALARLQRLYSRA